MRLAGSVCGCRLVLLIAAGLLGCGNDGGRPNPVPDAAMTIDGSMGGSMATDAEQNPGTGGTGGAPSVDADPPGDTAGNQDGATADLAGQPDLPPAFPRDVDGRLVINEIMASNGLTLKNEAGLAGDWIELFNPTTQDVPLAGYSLTDDLNLPARAVIQAGVVVPAGGYLLLWLDGLIDRGPTHLPLKLDADKGGSLGLARPDGSFISRLAYGVQETDFSAAREPDGSDRWVIEWHPSPGKANPAGSGQPLAPASPGAPPEAVPAAGDLTETLLGYDAFAQLRIDIDADGISKLLANPRVYVPATLVFQGRSYGPVGLRLKGNNSFQPIDKKPSLRIKIDEYVPDAKFYGFKDLTLNNMHSDASMAHERLAYWVARHAGVPSSRASHTMVSINGQAPALYTNVETVKRKMLSRWFKNPDGPLYECTNVDFASEYLSLFELQSKVDDRSLLDGLAKALTNPSPDQAMAAAANYINLPEFISFWAASAVIAQYDAWPYTMPGDDFYVYANPEDMKLHLIPWGMDETFGADDLDIVASSHSVLARTCAASPACRQQFLDRVWALMDKLEAMNWVGEYQRVVKMIAPYTVMDKSKVYTDAEVLLEQDATYWFFMERRASLSKFHPPRTTP